MNRVLLNLAQQRERLVARSGAQRVQFTGQASALRTRLAGIDCMLSLGRRIKAHPFVATALAAAILLHRPRHTLRWITRGIAFYSFGRKLFTAFTRT